MGRYLKPDPIGLEGGINPYSYAGQNPINSIDPHGLKKFYINGTWSYAFVDINSPKVILSVPLFDGDTFGVDTDGTPSFGFSTALIGYSGNLTTDTPFSGSNKSCNSTAYDNIFIYLSYTGSRHFSTYSNLTGTKIGRNYGSGVSLPFVNAGIPIDTAVQLSSDHLIEPGIISLSNKFIEPATVELSNILNSILK